MNVAVDRVNIGEAVHALGFAVVEDDEGFPIWVGLDLDPDLATLQGRLKRGREGGRDIGVGTLEWEGRECGTGGVAQLGRRCVREDCSKCLDASWTIHTTSFALSLFDSPVLPTLLERRNERMCSLSLTKSFTTWYFNTSSSPALSSKSLSTPPAFSKASSVGAYRQKMPFSCARALSNPVASKALASWLNFPVCFRVS